MWPILLACIAGIVWFALIVIWTQRQIRGYRLKLDSALTGLAEACKECNESFEQLGDTLEKFEQMVQAWSKR